ncbi:MAG TPA: hypothetical protein VGR71_16110, partial [Nitrospira sp.]|nr:hypothetical protein [Nitrospira sp.]
MAKFKKPYKRPAPPELKGSPRDAIQAALERWARPAMPDYASFGEWLAEKLTIKDRDLVLPHLRTSIRSETASYVKALLDLHQEYEERVRAANQTHGPIGESHRVLFNSFKLLIQSTEGLSTRTKETFALASHLRTLTERLDEDLLSCSQGELRARFFIALERENDRVALKLLGRLREQDHDPGELAYLEALCHLHANEFGEAIYWAKKVPVGAIDYPAAGAVVLESQAFLADADGLTAELHARQPHEITPSFLSYLMQVCIRQSDSPDTAVAAFNEFG